MPIPDKFEIDWSKEMVRGVIFGVENLILAMKTKTLGKQLLFGCMCGRFRALMGPLMVSDGLKQRNGWWGHFWGGVPDIIYWHLPNSHTLSFLWKIDVFAHNFQTNWARNLRYISNSWKLNCSSRPFILFENWSIFSRDIASRNWSTSHLSKFLVLQILARMAIMTICNTSFFVCGFFG